MAVKKSNIIGIALLLALAVSPVSGTFANAENNNLIQLDLKRSSNNSVDVTLFTSNNYNDNVLVRKKSDNKYVILIPKIQSNGYSSSSLNGVKDLVSNIDVKTVNDTNGGYTKVTLITTKPLNINTSTQKSTPVTAEQKEYKTLIAQANAVKNNIAKQTTQPQKISQKTEITVNKAQNTSNQKAQQKINKENTNINKTINNKVPQTKVAVKPQIKLTEIQPQKVQSQNNKKEELKKLIQEAKQEKNELKVPENKLTEIEKTRIEPTQIKDINEIPKNYEESRFSIVKNVINKIKAVKIPKSVNISIAIFAILIILSKIIKAANKKAKIINEQYLNHIAGNSPVINTIKYNNIVNNNDLSWQEKYQSYLSKFAKPVSRGNNKGNYTFIKKPAQPDEITKKRYELEKMLEEMPANNDFDNNYDKQFEELFNEDEIIHKTIKFKAFDKHKISLNTADRTKSKSRFKKYEKEIPLQEQKNVELGDSIIHSNPRRLKDGNLNVLDVDKKRLKYKQSDYIMSSVDEFFSILDKEKTETKEVLTTNQTNPLNIVKQKIETQALEKEENKLTNPITKSHNETKASYLNGLIVKSGYNIDENKGFYIVNLDGKSALIGKVNDEVFVLKKFDKNVTSPIQVRHDNANVYMVKTDGFKSLVEVNPNKMGVLIEL